MTIKTKRDCLYPRCSPEKRRPNFLPNFMPSFHISYTVIFLWEQGTGLERIEIIAFYSDAAPGYLPYLSHYFISHSFFVFQTGKSHRPRSCLATGNCAPIFLLIFLSAFYLAPKFFCEQENRHISQAAILLFRAAFQKGGEGEPRNGDNCSLRGCFGRLSPLFISFSHSSFKREFLLCVSCAA